MIRCEFCNAVMTSAPRHDEHTDECYSAQMWKAIDAYVGARGGNTSKMRRTPASEAARLTIDDLIKRRSLR